MRHVISRDASSLEVIEPLGALLPEGLKRGSTVLVSGTSLALALVAGPGAAGSWVAGVGLADLGLDAAAELGVPLERLVLVAPKPATWASTMAALVDAFDVVLVRLPGRVAAADARRLVARARNRGSILVVVEPSLESGPTMRRWPLPPDLRLTVVQARWEGLATGVGRLEARRVVVEAGGRGRHSQIRQIDLWLPGPDGGVGWIGPRAVADAGHEPLDLGPVREAAS